MSHRPPKVTVIGGGNGISVVLEGLANRVRSGMSLDITAVVATADDGGSSGRIRRQRGGLPPGDLRRCLLALAGSGERPFAKLFGHRYRGKGDLAGHAVGNLVLSALAEQHGCYLRALETAGRMLETCGRVLPMTLDTVHLDGVTRDGRKLSGESRIGNAPTTMKRVALSPPDVEPAPGVLGAIRDADLVVIGPGSLFTSILPVLLVPGVARAVRECRGERLLVANLMTQPGETRGMDLEDHLAAIDDNAGPGLVRHVMVAEDRPGPKQLESYASRQSEPVVMVPASNRSEHFLRAPLAIRSGRKIRHHPDRLARALLALAGNGRPAAAHMAARRPRTSLGARAVTLAGPGEKEVS